MRSSIRFLSVLALYALTTACGSDGKSTRPIPEDGGLDGAVTGGSGGGGSGGRAGSGGSSGSGGRASGGSGNTAGDGGSGNTAGDGGSGNTAGDGGSVECGDITCTAPAICDDSGSAPTCVCPVGYRDVNGDGSECEPVGACADGGTGGAECLKDDGEACSDADECSSGHCVGDLCCAVACDSPNKCQEEADATCVNGATCRYRALPDNTPCDDGDACTESSCFDGACQVDSGIDCSDEDACTRDTCDPETGACIHTPIDVEADCGDDNPCTTDSCDSVLGCIYVDDNAASCSDGDACTDDACNNGVCVGTAVDCSGSGDGCNEGVCNGGACEAQPANSGGACSEDLSACDSAGSCDADGACVGNDNACGNLATSCAACSGGADCFQGRRCTCRAMSGGVPVILRNGRCVRDTDECNQDPCHPLATACNDPTPGGAVQGDVVCTCPSGYSGDGLAAGEGCVDIDECAQGTPCGPGATCDGLNPPGSYTCTCGPGLTSITTATGPRCVCDLGGTYVMVATSNVSWAGISAGGFDAIEASPPGGVDTYSWSLRHQTIQANGTLRVETIPCGGTTPDLCDTIFNFAHAQYQPNQVWGKAKINAGFPVVTAQLTNARPGGNYNEPQVIALMGITLANPAGAWPPCRQCVGVNAGQTCTCPGQEPYRVTNRATWFDADEDNKLGTTTVDVSRGGELINGMYPDPPHDYTEPSECPRLATPQGTFNYSEWPGIDSDGNGFRAYQWYGGSRVTSAVRGNNITLDANQECRISGTLTGPGGRVRADARIAGCETCNNINPSGCTVADACNDAETDSYDVVEQSQTVNSVNFVLQKSSLNLTPILALPDGANKESMLNQACAEVREAHCPAGKVCN